MIDAKKLYPQEESDWFSSPSDYTPILDAIGTVILRVDDDDYQGDTRVLFSRGRREFGFLSFGWGSCSGCDALQACDSFDAIQKVVDGMEKETVWGNAEAIAKHIKSRIEANTYYSSSSDWNRFLTAASALLGHDCGQMEEDR